MATLYRARAVYPVSADPIEDGAVVVERGSILAVELATSAIAHFGGVDIVDMGESALFPAAVNVHTHLELTGLADALPHGLEFGAWVRGLMHAKRPLGREEFIAGARAGIAEMIESGTAAVGEICTDDASIGPLAESGMRGIVYLEMRNGDPAQAELALRATQEWLARVQAEFAGGRLRFGLSLHAPYSVSAPLFRLTSEWCAEQGVPLCVHVAESPAETQWLRERSGPIADQIYAPLGRPTDLEPPTELSPVRYLASLGVLEARPLLVHAVHVDADDIGILAAAGITVAHCPRSNDWLTCGRMPYRRYRDAGVALALGTDSRASAPSLSIWEELAFAMRAHTDVGEAPAPADLLRMATLDGARALGLESEIGALAEGKSAELACAALDSLRDDERHDPAAVLSALAAGRITARRVHV